MGWGGRHGVAHTFSPPSVTPPANGAATATLTFTADPTASIGGPFTFHVTGTSDTLDRPIDVQVSVNLNPWSGAGAVPTVETLPATEVTATSALLHGRVNPNGLATTWEFVQGDIMSWGSPYSPLQNLGYTDNQWHDVSYRAEPLSANTNYIYVIRATNSAGTLYGSNLG